MPTFAFILGREPHLSVAELAAVLGDGADWTKAELRAEALVIPTPSRSPSPWEGEKKTVSPPPHGSGPPPPNRGGAGVVLPLPTEGEREGVGTRADAWGGEGGWALSLMSRLGGTVKIGTIWRTVLYKTAVSYNTNPRTGDEVRDAIGTFILDHTTPDRKVHFGFSVYDLGGGAARVRTVRDALRRGAAAQKAWLTEHGRKVRWVTSRDATLSSVVVAKNDLLPERNGVEVLVLVAPDRVLLAQTLAVQPFEAWGAHDFSRPDRDARSGMLPPKLARMMINIGISSLRSQVSSLVLLDPFCGNGTVVTEAMRIGVPKVIGADIRPGAAIATSANIDWLLERNIGKRVPRPPKPNTDENGKAIWVYGHGAMCTVAHEPAEVQTEVCDARALRKCVAPQSVDAIVTEPFLGPPLGSRGVPAKKLAAITAELHELYVDAFRSFADVLKPGGRVVFVVPVWRGATASGARGGDATVVFDAEVAKFGFRRVRPFPVALRDHDILRAAPDLPYARPDQRVGRRILVFEWT